MIFSLSKYFTVAAVALTVSNTLMGGKPDNQLVAFDHMRNCELVFTTILNDKNALKRVDLSLSDAVHIRHRLSANEDLRFRQCKRFIA